MDLGDRPADQAPATALARSLGAWRVGDGPLYRRLASALALAAQRGDLAVGDLLPAERHLAARLGVSRSTVVAAYAELRARGLAQTKRGSGTALLSPGPARVRPRVFAAGLVREAGADEHVLDLSIGAPRADELVADLLSRPDWHRHLGSHGYRPFGLPTLCHALAERHSRADVRTRPDEILVTAGGQEALTLVTAEVAEGRAVVTETPTYAGAIGAFQAQGATVHTVPRDEEGPRTDRLEQVLRSAPGVAFLYVSGACHVPTGRGTTDGRRAELLELARHYGVLVVEDCAMDDMRFLPGAGTPLWQMDPERVIALGTLSKVVWPGLRVGWLRAARPLMDRLLERKVSGSLGTSIPSQVAALHALEDLDRIAVRRRGEARRGMGEALDLLADRIPEWPVQPADGGWSLWFPVPGGDARGLARIARRHGVQVAPGPSAGLRDEHEGHLRVCTALPDADLAEAVDRLGRAWEEHRDRGTPTP